MARLVLAHAVICAGLLAAAPQLKERAPEKKPATIEQEPPEEDEGFKDRVYTFNPLQASKEIEVGKMYAKKGNWKAARNRYREATRWNPNSADAFLLLAQAQDKLKDTKAAREAYEKYLELAPAGKEAEAVRRKLKRT